MKLNGQAIAGSPQHRKREKDDFYATSPQSVLCLLERIPFPGEKILEPCVCQGHILKTIEDYYPFVDYKSMDIVDRGFPNTIVADFLTYDFNGELFDAIITNPPFSYALEFVEKSLSIVKERGTVAMFLKISFLESTRRKNFFMKNPPKEVMVFSKRQQTWKGGNPFNEKGKPWSTIVCYAWFIWEKGYKGDTKLCWI